MQLFILCLSYSIITKGGKMRQRNVKNKKEILDGSKNVLKINNKIKKYRQILTALMIQHCN